MTIDPDFTNDCGLFDGRQAVTLRLPASSDDAAAAGLKRPLTQRELELSGGAYLPGDVRWHFEAACLTIEPIVGTQIVEADGRTWVVVGRSDGVFGSRCTCTARPVGGD